MAITTAQPLKRPSTGAADKPTYAPVETGTYQAQIEEITLQLEAPYGKPNAPKEEWEEKIRILFRILTPGDFYGRTLLRTVSQSLSPGGKDRKESNLHAVVKAALHKGVDLTSDEITAYSLDASKLNKLEGAQLLLSVLEANGKPKIVGYAPAKRDLPKFVRPVDPRAAELDNPLLTCSVTGEVLVGWEATRGENAGKWITNTEWAAMQADMLGTAAAYTFDDHPGKKFAPPFGPRYYRQAKAQREGSGR